METTLNVNEFKFINQENEKGTKIGGKTDKYNI